MQFQTTQPPLNILATCRGFLERVVYELKNGKKFLVPTEEQQWALYLGSPYYSKLHAEISFKELLEMSSRTMRTRLQDIIWNNEDLRRILEVRSSFPSHSLQCYCIGQYLSY